MHHALRAEALWAVDRVRAERTVADSALLFVSWNALDRYLDALRTAWAHPACLHAVAIKSQPHTAVLRHVVRRGFGLEAATWEEVRLARAAGCPAERIVFDSPVKRPHEIADCAAHGAGMLVNANTIEELPRLEPHAGRLRVGLRINPLVETGAERLYHVSGADSKFGEPISNRAGIEDAILRFPIEALHVHAGSTLRDLAGAVEAVGRLRDLALAGNARLAAAGADRRIGLVDVGGGLAPEHLAGGRAPGMESWAGRLRSEFPELWTDFSLVTEFGQWTHCHTGYALSDVEYVLARGGRQVAYLHLGADFMLRDAYVAPRGVSWLPLRAGRPLAPGTELTDLAGPLCFAGDYLERGVPLPGLRQGDEMLLLGTGSNAYALWSRHTSRTIPAVYGIDHASRTCELLSPRHNPFLADA